MQNQIFFPDITDGAVNIFCPGTSWPVEAPLLEDDEKFNDSFRKLIKLANDLDDLPEAYKTKEFSDHESVEENRDGQDLSGINLHSIFSDYEDTFEKLKEPSQRISVTAEKIKEARAIIDEQISNVYAKYFEIITNLLNGIFKNQSEIFKKEAINSANYNINKIFDSLPNFISVVTPAAYQSAVYGKTDQTKYVLTIRNFEDQERIRGASSVLKGRKDVLIINLVHSDKYQVTSPKVYVDTLGRKRKRGMEIKNFINFEFNDFRQFADILTRIEQYLA